MIQAHGKRMNYFDRKPKKEIEKSTEFANQMQKIVSLYHRVQKYSVKKLIM